MDRRAHQLKASLRRLLPCCGLRRGQEGGKDNRQPHEVSEEDPEPPEVLYEIIMSFIV